MIDEWRQVDSGFDGLPSEAFSLINQKNSVLLDSASEPGKLARYSIIACYPDLIVKAKNGLVEVRSESGEKYIYSKDPLDVVHSYYKEGVGCFEKSDFYSGGPIGFLSYDYNRYLEEIPDSVLDDFLLPDMYFIFPRAVMVYDKKLMTWKIFSHKKVENNLINCLDKKPKNKEYRTGKVTCNMSKRYFKRSVNRIKDYIYDGDVYQVNFSQRFSSSFSGDFYSLYDNMTKINPSPFSGILNFDDFSVLLCSPERLVKLDGNKVETRPIAGTRRRGKGAEEDSYLSGNLLLDPKEQAEHIMLVDLERNDIGKVCNYGSVKCDELMITEKYSHVIHIVSNVIGDLSKDKDAFDLLKAVFPGGTITGCPKVRCMEIIEELEPTRRGPYTGSAGYFGYNGSMDFNIIIRSFVLKRDRLYFQAGAGIVADSDPEREYFETLSKAKALFQSLDIDFKETEWENLSY